VYDRVKILPRLGPADYQRLLAACDVLLDPIHFGGGTTGYEALALGTPVVTWPSELLRGRLTYALYCRMGLPDLVAHDGAGYVERVVRLGTEADYRHEMRQRIAAMAGVLYDDVAVVRDVEEALVAMAEGAPASTGPAAPPDAVPP
jgi:predicted O-linked N-acetylglucosamine transferase (SPINDLY family)